MSKTIAVYHRVSTEEQNLDRQVEATTDYATSRFNVALPDIEFFEDKSTGTDVERDGYMELMEAVKEGSIDVVVVKELSRMARSLQDLEQTVDEIVDNGVEIHFIEEGLSFTGEKDPFQELQFKILGAVAEFQAKLRQESAREGLQARIESDEDYRHGPAPLGYDKDSGHLYQKEYYPEVKEALRKVKEGELSKRKASKQLDTSRATIRRAIDERPELYNLNIPGEQGES